MSDEHDLGLPELMPENAPEPGACVRVERLEEDRLVRLVIDPPHRANPVFDVPLMRDLGLALDQVADFRKAVGLVLTGRDPLTFCYGADLDGIGRIETVEQSRRLAQAGCDVFQRLYRLSREGGGRLRTVAAVGGPVPGGAFEVSLACDFVVAARDPRTRIGLPEVQLGIVPGWGGSDRLPRRIGVPAALEAILQGKLYRADQAYRKGLVDRLTWPVYLDRVAADVALGRERLERRERGWKAWAVDRNPAALSVIARLTRNQVAARTGGHYPAAPAAIDLVLASTRRPIEEGLRAEAEAIGWLANTPVCRHLVGIFHASEAAKGRARGADGSRPPRFERAAVIGGGTMGGAIAGLLAKRGTPTRLRDLQQAALDEAVAEHRADVAKSVQRRSLARNEGDAAIDRLEATRSALGFGACDFVLEAVAERMEVKHAVLGELASLARPDAVLATNTSSLSVDEMAAPLPSPERVVGMHFFNPVRKMPLVEVVRGARTDDAVVRRVVQLALDLGKTPVVTRDRPGFVVNRLLAPYLDEAVRLFEQGAEPAELDRLASRFGLPMGPFELLDEVGLDIAAHAAASLHAAFGERMAPARALQPLVDAGELGKKTRLGVYRHAPRRKGLVASARRLLGAESDGPARNPRLARPGTAPAIHGLAPEALLDRLLLPMVNEAARCLEERVVETPAELDLATVYGMGFPPFRGGVLAWADSIGAAAVVERLRRCADSPGVADRGAGRERFEPCALLVEAAERGGRLR